MADELTPAPEAASVPASVPEPIPPQKLAQEDQTRIMTRATELVAQVKSDPGDREVARSLGRLGADAQQQAGAEMDLLKTRVGALLNDLDGDAAQIPKGLLALRRTMDAINPHALASKPRGFFSKLLRRAPVVGDVLADIAIK